MSIDFIPVEQYAPIYYHILLILLIITFLHTLSSKLGSEVNVNFMAGWGHFLLLFVILYIGLRPLDPVFADMVGYGNMFRAHQDGYFYFDEYNKDLTFQYFIKLCTYILDINTFFLVCAFLYVFPLYLVSKKWFGKFWFYSFFILVVSFSFWGYGVNGIRNGIATSFFLLAASREKRIYQIAWFALSMSFHFAMILPIVGFVLATVYNKPLQYIFFWFFCILLSLLAGSFFSGLIGSIGIEDERMSYFSKEIDEGKFSSTGFRWDFLLYSATAVYAGWYYIFKKNFRDKNYLYLFNTYVISNAFWILVIEANFSNRFAYLSWFMMGLVIIYPLLKLKIVNSQHQRIGQILMIYFLFTYFMNVIIA